MLSTAGGASSSPAQGMGNIDYKTVPREQPLLGEDHVLTLHQVLMRKMGEGWERIGENKKKTVKILPLHHIIKDIKPQVQET